MIFVGVPVADLRLQTFPYQWRWHCQCLCVFTRLLMLWPWKTSTILAWKMQVRFHLVFVGLTLGILFEQSNHFGCASLLLFKLCEHCAINSGWRKPYIWMKFVAKCLYDIASTLYEYTWCSFVRWAGQFRCQHLINSRNDTVSATISYRYQLGWQWNVWNQITQLSEQTSTILLNMSNERKTSLPDLL